MVEQPSNDSSSSEPKQDESLRKSSRELLDKVYHQLRTLAAQKLRHEKPGQTLDATSLVHEAWMRVKKDDTEIGQWANEEHFFSAAAEAMRRILIENARRKKTRKHGGEMRKNELLDFQIVDEKSGEPIVKATKCDLCADNLGGPACERACPHDALSRVDLTDGASLSKLLERVAVFE